MKVITLSSLFFICFFSTPLLSQKVGHLSTVQVIDSLTEAKQASATLKQYEASLSKTGEEMVVKFQEKVKKYQLDMKAGSLTAVQRKQVESDLEIDQNAINTYRQSAQISLEKRRQELIQPILDKINKAIQEIGKEENYMFIFDNAVGILYFSQSEDVSAKLYKKLGY
ncbi:MAG: OmpH family outer membrane protein [Saprospiraceae bacterium]|nr:OmpH family outer membrane protein [Saprospiraceae bacterium]MBK9727292.1 OmpH family outer membrane protein [Saprospiraceae bacterium]